MDVEIGDLVWVRFPQYIRGENKRITRWIFGYVVEQRPNVAQQGVYKIHLFEFGMTTTYFINDIRILEQKTTIYENEVNK